MDGWGLERDTENEIQKESEEQKWKQEEQDVGNKSE